MTQLQVALVRWALLAFCILFWIGVFYAVKAVLA